MKTIELINILFKFKTITTMKTKKILFALFAMVCMMAVSVTLTACGSDDDETTIEYSLGFSSMNGDFTESAIIDDTFKAAIGVTTDTFTYPAGEDKLRTACEQAARQLDNRAFTGEYTYVVSKFTNKGKSDFYKWSNKK